MIRLISTIAFLFLSTSCTEGTEKKEQSRHVPGEVQILNACGIHGAADKVRSYLMSKGFDVVEVSNATHWNVRETIVGLRNPHWQGGIELASALGTSNLILLENPATMVDATIFVGKDFEERIIHE